MEEKTVVFLARQMSREERMQRARDEGAALIAAKRSSWDQIIKELHTDIQALRARGSKSKTAVISRLKVAASRMAEDWAPLASCGKGCSTCCNGAVGVDESDARHIAEVTGAPMAKPGGKPIDVHAAAALGPCRFLKKDGACGIYAARPLACRNTLALYGVPEEDCGPKGKGEFAGNTNGSLFRTIASHYTGDVVQRDIREWFPHGMKR